MRWHIISLALGVAALALSGCGPKAKSPEVDAVTQEMQQAVADSAARVRVAGRTDWEVMPDQNQYWVNVTLENVGDDGPVALRAAIQTVAPYFGIGESPTQPEYFRMGPGATISKRLIGSLSAKRADKAIGVNVEVYPRASGQPERSSPLKGIPGIGGAGASSLDQLPQGE